jgi:hypothetical protein
VSCGERFEAVGEVECPACGSVTMGSQLDERIEIERADGPGSSDPAERADRPSGTGSGGVHDTVMGSAATAGHPHADRHGPAHIDPERPDDRVT